MKKHEPKYIEVEGIMRACYDSFLKTGNKAYSEIIALADAVPAADVVEVVRCKDCKMYRKEKELAEAQYCNPNYYCGLLQTEMDEDGYCSYGRRKGE